MNWLHLIIEGKTKKLLSLTDKVENSRHDFITENESPVRQLYNFSWRFYKNKHMSWTNGTIDNIWFLYEKYEPL